MRVFVEETVPTAVPEGLVLRYGISYCRGASDVMLQVVRKRQLPVIGGGTGIWSFTEITDAAAATVAAVSHGAPGDDEPAPVAHWVPTWPRAWARSRPCAPRPGWAGCWAAR
jgi:2-alkyl-3-oxoalkanoate reductase